VDIKLRAPECPRITGDYCRLCRLGPLKWIGPGPTYEQRRDWSETAQRDHGLRWREEFDKMRLVPKARG
jgi:hypothetical protein